MGFGRTASQVWSGIDVDAGFELASDTTPNEL